ncbi:MAG TPA: dipeptidase [Prolixibacteraceae bacterium]|nr:dipeptidase [Prolixibacteraceae bacterium]HPS12293.1 dipeptidase [Prolixibacteraceae bacterium]
MSHSFSKFSGGLFLILFFFSLTGFKDPGSIHKNAIVIDTHTDTPMLLVEQGINLREKHVAPASRVDYPRLKEGGVDAIFFGLFTSQKPRMPENTQEAYNTASQMLDSIAVSVGKNRDLVSLAYASDDAKRISGEGKTAIYLGMENGFPIGTDISRVKMFYDRGVRYITLCHSSNNDICDSSTDPKGSEYNGLSDFGKEVVAEMNRLGMLVDVSHISDSAFYDVLRLCKAPVFASHSSVRSICNHPRNMSDDMIRKLAEKGGVIQICILDDYIREADTTSMNYIKKEELRIKYHDWDFANDSERKLAWATWDEIDSLYPVQQPCIAQAVNHIDYVVKLVGIDHVGIGSDFDGGGGLSDCDDVACFPKITEELVKRGYSEEDIDKIWGGNFLRVFKEVEDCTRRVK